MMIVLVVITACLIVMIICSIIILIDMDSSFWPLPEKIAMAAGGILVLAMIVFSGLYGGCGEIETLHTVDGDVELVVEGLECPSFKIKESSLIPCECICEEEPDG